MTVNYKKQQNLAINAVDDFLIFICILKALSQTVLGVVSENIIFDYVAYIMHFEVKIL